jgi:serine/threonine protein kinase
MEIISKLRHRHLVSIIGHCIVNDEGNPNIASSVYLISESVSNGSLRSHLTGNYNALSCKFRTEYLQDSQTYSWIGFAEWRKREMLKWPQRVSASIGVARGIQFLHNVTDPGIVQNDLNTENILLDKTLTSKISGFSLPMISSRKNGKVSSKDY